MAKAKGKRSDGMPKLAFKESPSKSEGGVFFRDNDVSSGVTGQPAGRWPRAGHNT